MRIQLNNVVELRIFCSSGDQASVNVRHYRCSTISGQGADLVVAASELSPGIGARMAPLLSVNATFDGIGLRTIVPKPPSVEALSNVGSATGTVAGAALPTQTSGIVSFRTDLAGRNFRGRLFIPFPGGSDADLAGLPIDTYLTRATNLGTFLRQIQVIGTAPDQSTLVPVIYHRAAMTSSDITQQKTSRKWATQRRRGSFGRPNTSPI